MVRAVLFSIGIASTSFVAGVAQPIGSFNQKDKFEREFVESVGDVDLASRADTAIDLVEGLAEREPFWFLAPLIASGAKAIKAAVDAKKAKKAAQKAAGGPPPPPKPKKQSKAKGGKKGKKGKREFLDEDTEDLELFQREAVEEFVRRYLEDSLESSFDRRDWVESLEALD
ncbi:hypothetical protein H1R20_g16566, partial [Candolleomyces eurysporus]